MYENKMKNTIEWKNIFPATQNRSEYKRWRTSRRHGQIFPATQNRSEYKL